MNCLKFHCPAGLPQLPAGRLGTADSRGEPEPAEPGVRVL